MEEPTGEQSSDQMPVEIPEEKLKNAARFLTTTKEKIKESISNLTVHALPQGIDQSRPPNDTASRPILSVNGNPEFNACCLFSPESHEDARERSSSPPDTWSYPMGEQDERWFKYRELTQNGLKLHIAPIDEHSDEDYRSIFQHFIVHNDEGRPVFTQSMINAGIERFFELPPDPNENDAIVTSPAPTFLLEALVKLEKDYEHPCQAVMSKLLEGFGEEYASLTYREERQIFFPLVVVARGETSPYQYRPRANGMLGTSADTTENVPLVHHEVDSYRKGSADLHVAYIVPYKLVHLWAKYRQDCDALFLGLFTNKYPRRFSWDGTLGVFFHEAKTNKIWQLRHDFQHEGQHNLLEMAVTVYHLLNRQKEMYRTNPRVFKEFIRHVNFMSRAVNNVVRLSYGEEEPPEEAPEGVAEQHTIPERSSSKHFSDKKKSKFTSPIKRKRTRNSGVESKSTRSQTKRTKRLKQDDHSYAGPSRSGQGAPRRSTRITSTRQSARSGEDAPSEPDKRSDNDYDDLEDSNDISDSSESSAKVRKRRNRRIQTKTENVRGSDGGPPGPSGGAGGRGGGGGGRGLRTAKRGRGAGNTGKGAGTGHLGTTRSIQRALPIHSKENSFPWVLDGNLPCLIASSPELLRSAEYEEELRGILDDYPKVPALPVMMNTCSIIPNFYVKRATTEEVHYTKRVQHREDFVKIFWAPDHLEQEPVIGQTLITHYAGETLKSYCASYHNSAGTKHRPLHILSATVRAIMALHSMGIAHGDIKPDNICVPGLKSNQAAMIIDLGWAMGFKKPKRGSFDQSHVKLRFGTGGWRAPEVNAKDVTSLIAADVYSIGCVVAYVQRCTSDEGIQSISPAALCREDPLSRLPLHQLYELLSLLE